MPSTRYWWTLGDEKIGALGIGADDEQVRLPLAQVTSDARDRAARADGEDERVYLAARLLPELGPGRLVVRLRVGRIRVLVGLERARDLLREAVRDGVVALRGLRRDGRRADDDLRPVGAEQADLLLRHLVRHDEDAAVPLAHGGERQPDAGVAARRLDDRATLAERAGPLRGLDHAEADPVLDATARVQVLELRQDGRVDSSRHPIEPDEGRAAHEVEHGRMVAHAGSVRATGRGGRAPGEGRRIDPPPWAIP